MKALLKRILLVVGFLPAVGIGMLWALGYSIVNICVLLFAAIEWLIRGDSIFASWMEQDTGPDECFGKTVTGFVSFCLDGEATR